MSLKAQLARLAKLEKQATQQPADLAILQPGPIDYRAGIIPEIPNPPGCLIQLRLIDYQATQPPGIKADD